MVHAADSWRTRGRGLAGVDALPAGHALRLAPCRSVHTFGMRFALDLVWLARDGRVLRVDRAVAPRRAHACLRAHAVVEAAEGEGDAFARALDSGGYTARR